jgi:hypothetical protein
LQEINLDKDRKKETKKGDRDSNIIASCGKFILTLYLLNPFSSKLFQKSLFIVKITSTVQPKIYIVRVEQKTKQKNFRITFTVIVS